MAKKKSKGVKGVTGADKASVESRKRRGLPPIETRIRYKGEVLHVNSAEIHNLAAERDELRAIKKPTRSQAAKLAKLEEQLAAMRKKYHAVRLARTA